MRILLILGLLTIAVIAQAQVVPEWEAVYDAGKGYDEAHDIVTDAAGNIYVTGYSDIDKVGVLDFAVVTVKYNSAGEQLWLRRLDLDTNTSEYSQGIALDSAGNVFIGGEIFFTGGVPQATTRRLFVAKYDADGNLLWSQIQPNRTRTDRLTGDFTEIAVDPQGHVVLTGYGQSSGNQWDYLIYRYRPNGELAWYKKFGGSSGLMDELQGLALDDTGNVYVTGTIGVRSSTIPRVRLHGNTNSPIPESRICGGSRSTNRGTAM
jgi:DNA-binding beta-propeller fold protein YncE